MNYPKKILDLTDSNFRRTIEKYHLVLVDCYANWCSPCKRLAQTIDDMAKDYGGKVVFGRLNVDINRVTTNRFDIMGIPTLLIFKEGRLVGNIVGEVPRKEIEDRIKSHL